MPISIKHFGKRELSKTQRGLLILIGARGHKLFVIDDLNVLMPGPPGYWDSSMSIRDETVCALIEAGLLICYSPAPETYQWILSGDGVQWVAAELSARRYSLPQPDVLWDLN